MFFIQMYKNILHLYNKDSFDGEDKKTLYDTLILFYFNLFSLRTIR